MIAAAVATTATTTTVTKETEAKKGSRNDVKKAENKAEQSGAEQRRILTTSVSITKLQNRRQSALIIAG